jgi:hypothetical protein
VTHIEGLEGPDPSEKPKPPIEIGIAPDSPEQVVFKKTPSGGLTIFLKGEITVQLNPSTSQAVESPVRGAETVRSGSHCRQYAKQPRCLPTQSLPMATHGLGRAIPATRLLPGFVRESYRGDSTF